ncbi:MAG: hypothetical protein JWO20_1300 [Candidatus Angelobacter sp.]|jgi:hypothetical protein|nr:hypothetical protein [Candidatus Angelobacter sp.]
MRFALRSMMFMFVLGLLLLASGCASKGSTQLCDGFQSYETPDAVRNRLRQTAIADNWKEESQGTSRSDPRPPYQFIMISGPYRLSGFEGHLRLTFYNNRLMETEFTTANGREYMAAVGERQGRLPKNPGERCRYGSSYETPLLRGSRWQFPFYLARSKIGRRVA